MLSEEAGRVAWQSRPSGCGVLGLGACWGLGGLDLGFNRDGLSLVWEALGLKPSAFGSQRSDWELSRFCGLLTGCIISEVTCYDTLGSQAKIFKRKWEHVRLQAHHEPSGMLLRQCSYGGVTLDLAPLLHARACCETGNTWQG